MKASSLETKILYTVEINLVLIWTRLLTIKKLTVIPRETNKKIIKKYSKTNDKEIEKVQ